MAVSEEEFKKALSALREAVDFAKNRTIDSEFKIARDAAIQRFEFCIELAWKVSAKKLGSTSTTAKPVIREMAQNGYITNPETWFEFIEARNKSSHTYEEKVAQQVYQVLQTFLPEGIALLEVLQKK